MMRRARDIHRRPARHPATRARTMSNVGDDDREFDDARDAFDEDAPAGDVRISPEARRGRGRAGEWNVAPRHRRGLPGAETADERGACRVRRDDMPVNIVQVVWKKCRKRL